MMLPTGRTADARHLQFSGDPPWREADRYALHFTADGEWKLIPFREAADLRVFLARLTLHQWENQR